MRGEQAWLEALSWVGTPFHEQQATKGRGCDCKGLIWGVARELGFPEADSFYAKHIGYDIHRRGGIPVTMLKQGMADLFDRVTDMQAGDVLLLKHVRHPVHLAFVGPDERAIHATEPMVRNTSLSRVLLKVFTLDSIWRWRDGC